LRQQRGNREGKATAEQQRSVRLLRFLLMSDEQPRVRLLPLSAKLLKLR
jgi:hypothetical protein